MTEVLDRVGGEREKAGLEPLESALGHRFADRGLLREAVTHASSVSRASARPGLQNNQRLEFLGDRVVGLIAATLLLRLFPHEEEGLIARRHTAIVNGEALATIASDIGLADHLRLSQSEIDMGGRTNPGTLADALEAVAAALYLDGGLEAAERFLGPRLQALIATNPAPPMDAKTALQEWVQARGEPLPVYDLVDQSGPPHQPVFTVRVTIRGREPATGTARNKRAAEKAAAMAMLIDLGLVRPQA